MQIPESEMEIHVPGLYLDATRWNMHQMFLEAVVSSYEHVAAASWKGYEELGRGAVFVHSAQWMSIVREGWKEREEAFPHDYVPVSEAVRVMRLGPLNYGVLPIFAEYDPETQVILCARHHRGESFSAYLLTSEPGPRQAYTSMYGSTELRERRIGPEGLPPEDGE